MAGVGTPVGDGTLDGAGIPDGTMAGVGTTDGPMDMAAAEMPTGMVTETDMPKALSIMAGGAIEEVYRLEVMAQEDLLHLAVQTHELD